MKKFLVAIPAVRFVANGHDRHNYDSTVFKKTVVTSKVLSWGKIVNNACRLSVLMTKGEKRTGKILNDDGLYLKQRRISSDVCSSSLKKLLTDEKLKFKKTDGRLGEIKGKRFFKLFDLPEKVSAF
ncbi:hypothetical protein [Bartonella apis]|uniref:hypothetical protein n=1 Tax=Bartonella apis TaxID=1686310 RepID=UPI00242CF9AA|nr:hypothetical protein [Bartonella apis]MCT6824784.1 hypothetical protein [Bartonella apis]